MEAVVFRVMSLWDFVSMSVAERIVTKRVSDCPCTCAACCEGSTLEGCDISVDFLHPNSRREKFGVGFRVVWVTSETVTSTSVDSFWLLGMLNCLTGMMFSFKSLPTVNDDITASSKLIVIDSC